jgi:hypothetical protein
MAERIDGRGEHQRDDETSHWPVRCDAGAQSARRADASAPLPVTAYTISTEPPGSARSRSNFRPVSALSDGVNRIPAPKSNGKTTSSSVSSAPSARKVSIVRGPPTRWTSPPQPSALMLMRARICISRSSCYDAYSPN